MKSFIDMDLTELNRRFGALGRIVFREGPGGDAIATLVAPQGSCEISLYGGQVLSYRALGFQDTLWLSPLASFAHGDAIRGGVPICWPWFGKAPETLPPGTPSHGFARKALWQVVGSEYGARDTEIVLELNHELATSEAFPHPYQLKLTVSLGDCLTLDLQTRNLSDAPFTYSEAFHPYLRVGDARQIEVFGVEDAPMVFDEMKTHDVIYPKANAVAAVRDPVMERIVGVAADDANAVVVWHPALDHGMKDVSIEGPRHFVCVEPANPHQTHGEITLAPQESHTLTLRLQPTILK